jgi:hypothetical protein
MTAIVKAAKRGSKRRDVLEEPVEAADTLRSTLHLCVLMVPILTGCNGNPATKRFEAAEQV